MKLQNGPSVSLGANGVLGLHLSQGEGAVGIVTQPPGAALILRELLGGILGGKVLVKYQLSCLSFIMLCFHGLTGFL